VKKDKEIVNVSSEGEEDVISDIEVFSLNIYSGIKKFRNYIFKLALILFS
jgi:hypothetical protein